MNECEQCGKPTEGEFCDDCVAQFKELKDELRETYLKYRELQDKFHKLTGRSWIYGGRY